ncbi:hypothetical protein KHA80_20105 [Anaerobacillus sp. HL2]|nr:hypothetical protein KHA80_20105 [Anaerobacillus sp. HL2]
MAETVLPIGKEYTFWGHGLSQDSFRCDQTDRRCSNAVQYTIPISRICKQGS